jgi:lysophospholipase L1-like esterase
MADFNEVLILTDSIFKYCEVPFGARKISVRGATISSLASIVQENYFYDIDFSLLHLVILHVGTNDIDNGSRSVFMDYRQLIQAIKSQQPNMYIIVCAILPRPCDLSYTNSSVKRVNNSLQELCRRNGSLHFHSTYKGFLHHKQPIFSLYARDNLHLGRLGIVKASLILKTLIALWMQNRLTFW